MPTPFYNLPDSIKELLTSDELVDSVEKIAERYKLRPEEYGTLIRLSAKLLSGDMSPTAFIPSLMDEFDLTQTHASFIAQDINRDILNPVKTALQEVHRPIGTTPVPSPVVRPQPPRLNIPFSVSSALGNAPMGTAPAGLIPPPPRAPVPAAPRPPQMPPPPPTYQQEQGVHPAAMGNIFEEKLGGAFRMKSDAVAVAGSHPGFTVPRAPTQVVPPPPASSFPKPAGGSDPYREQS